MSRIIKSPNIKINHSDSFRITNEAIFVDMALNEIEIEEEVEEAIDLEAIKQEADNIIEDAKREAIMHAKQITDEAINEAEQLKIKVSEEAYQEGYQQGSVQAENDYNNKIQQAEAIRQEAIEHREAVVGEVEHKMVDLISQIATKVLDNEITFNKDSILYLVKNGLREIDSQKEIKIIVAPTQYDYVVQHKGELLTGIEKPELVEIIVDNTYNDGDCVIETLHGNVECSIDTQLEALKKELHLLYSM